MIYLHFSRASIIWVVYDDYKKQYRNIASIQEFFVDKKWYKTSGSQYKKFNKEGNFRCIGEFKDLNEMNEYVIGEFAEDLI